jgi:hypothetical protein
MDGEDGNDDRIVQVLGQWGQGAPMAVVVPAIVDIFTFFRLRKETAGAGGRR